MERRWIRAATAHLQDRASRLIACLGVSVILGLLLFGAALVQDLRAGAWHNAERNAANLRTLIEQLVARTIHSYDLSLIAAGERVDDPGLARVGPAVRRLALFDKAATATGFGTILITDAAGRVRIASGAVEARDLDLSGTAAFRMLRDDPHAGLVITKPQHCVVTGRPVIVLGRRITRPDGRFGGVVIGAIEIAYLNTLLEGLDPGAAGSLNVVLDTGELIARAPQVDALAGQNIAGGGPWRDYVRMRRGTTIGISALDGAERFYTFAHLDDAPLLVTVATATATIRAAWLPKALVVAALLGTLALLTLALTLLLQREVARRASADASARAANAELASQAMTDGLTGLPNRRRYDADFGHAFRNARPGSPLALLVIDADRFKAYNDHFGHQAGDGVLRVLGECLRDVNGSLGAVAYRIGGEEFAVLLPGVDGAAARLTAERIRRAVASRRLPHAPAAGGIVTVSIGVAHCVASADETPAALFAAADAALYEAKRSGRNRVRVSGFPDVPPETKLRA